MLGKVLKYDLKSVCRYLIPLYMVLLGLGLMIRILGFFENNAIINIILGIMIVALVLISAFSFVLNAIFVIKYFLDNLYKDEGYLTHTLPVKKGVLLSSKVLTALITAISTFIFLILSLLLAFYQKGLFDEIIKVFLENVGGSKLYEFFIFLGVYSLVGYLTTILMVFAAISIGYSKSSNKLVNSVVWALIFYFGMEFLYLGLLGGIMWISPEFITSLEGNTFIMKDLLNFFMIFMIFTVLIGIIYYLISYRFMSKKLNLE